MCIRDRLRCIVSFQGFSCFNRGAVDGHAVDLRDMVELQIVGTLVRRINVGVVILTRMDLEGDVLAILYACLLYTSMCRGVLHSCM